MPSALRISSLVACTFAIACSGSLGRSPDGTAAPQTVIHPGGGPTGALVLKLPAGLTVQPGEIIISKAAASGAQALNPDQPLELDPDGTYCVGWRGAKDCTVKVVANQTTTYPMGGIHVTFPGGSGGNLGTDIGVYATLNINTSDDKTRVMYSVSPVEFTYLFLPGSYKTFIEMPPAFPSDIAAPPSSSVTVAQGQVVDWPLTIPDWRFRIHVLVPTSRAYPDVDSGASYSLAAPYGNARIDIATPQKDLVIHVPPAGVSSSYSYTLSVFRMPLTIPAGAPNTQVDIPISRIDVDDVAYTRPDGSAATVPGTWTVTRRGGAPGPVDNTPVIYGATSYPTSRGVDVIAGTYDGTVSYNLQDLGGQKTDTFNITF